MQFISRLAWFFRGRWLFYLITVILLGCTTFLNSIAPRLIGTTIDRIRTGDLTAPQLQHTVLLLIGLALLVYLLVYTWQNMLFGSSVLLERLLRDRLFKHWTGMPPSFFQRNRSGELMALASNDIQAVSQTAGFGVLTLVNTVVAVIVVIVSMIVFVSFKLMLAALLPMPFLALAINRLGQAMRRRFTEAQASFGRMNDHVLESIGGMRVLRAYVQEREDREAFDKVTQDVMQRNIKVAFINALFQPAITTIVGLSYAIGIGYGSYLVFQNEITLGQLVTFNIYLGLLIWPMIAFGEFINIFQRGNASIQRIQDNLDQQNDVLPPLGAQDGQDQPASQGQSMYGGGHDQPALPLQRLGTIELESLSFRYPGASSDALQQLSLVVEPGETLGIVGRTGSGKSTLIKLLLHQYPVPAGRVRISGVPIEQLDPDALRSHIGYVPQEHQLLSRSIRANLTLGKPDANEREVEEAVRMAALDGDLAQMKEGLETVIGENGVMLSGGQKQRLGIARALLVEPQLLLLDDALSAVDARTEHAILRHIREARQGKTTLIATHRLSAVAHAQQIVVLEEGRVVQRGSHAELMAQEGWYRTQYVRQQVEQSLLGEDVEQADEQPADVSKADFRSGRDEQ